MACYHQFQDFDLAGEWEKLQGPERILRVNNDWTMSADDNYLIVEALGLKRTYHLLHEFPGLGHWNTIQQSAKDPYYEGKEGQWDQAMVDLIIQWARPGIWQDRNKPLNPLQRELGMLFYLGKELIPPAGNL